MPSSLDIDQIAVEAEQIIRQAGEMIRQAHQQTRHVMHKGEINLVTETDLAVEAYIVGELKQRYPDHAIVAEEGTDIHSSSGYVWIVDPLDGTNNFAHGFPVFSVTFALLDQAGPLLGLTYDPLLDELFTAIRGEGAYLNGRRIQVSGTQDFRQSLISTGFAYDRLAGADTNLPALMAVMQGCMDIRRAGSAALDTAYVACGRLEGHWERGLQMWDVAAGVLFVQEAGGRVSNYAGEYDPSLIRNNCRLVFSNGHVHQHLLAALLSVYGPEGVRDS